jgi:uncharacterized membrane-anchored protein YjiN (DUF445 family)
MSRRAAKTSASDGRRRSHVGTVSLLVAVAGAVLARVALADARFADLTWVRIVASGFEAAVVGALADWFAVTALFRHPLGIPIPHTAIIPRRRDRIIEGIVSMVRDEWLAPEVIASRLRRFAPSEIVVDWLSDPAHVRRLGEPVRDVMRVLTRLLDEPDVVALVDRFVRGQLRAVPLDASAGRWLQRVVQGENAAAAFRTAALSLARLVQQPGTAEVLERWLDRSASQLRREGKRLVPLILRRKLVQRKIVEAGCDYARAEMEQAAAVPRHPLRRFVFEAANEFAERLAAGESNAQAQLEQLRATLVDSLEAGPLVGDLLRRLRSQLEGDLERHESYLAGLIDRRLHAVILELLDDPARRAAFDHWVRTMADELLRRHHDQIGLTVRESLEALDTNTLVTRIEDRVGADLQFIRLNGAVVGGLIGVILATAHLVGW